MREFAKHHIAALVTSAVLIIAVGVFIMHQGPAGVGVAEAEQEQEEAMLRAVLNCAPLFDADATLVFDLDESNLPGANVGNPVSAIDPEGFDLSYSLLGDDADAFDIDGATGQLTVKDGVSLDRDTKESYSVFVVASDVHDAASCARVQVNIVDNSYSHTHTEKRTVCRRYRVDGGCDRRFRPLTTTITVTTCESHRHEGTDPAHSTGPCHE